MPKINAVSLFSGCGGFDFGATQAGVDIVWANDIDAAAASAYKSILPNTDFHLGDIREVQHFPPADLLIGCYPCTGFSIAARRRAKNAEKRDLMGIEGNFLYLEFLRALRQVSPKFFFVENVRGMLSACNGWFFNEQIKGFESCGYVTAYKNLIATDFGTPQARERVFIVGTRHDIAQDFHYTFPLPSHGNTTNTPVKTLHESIGHLPLNPIGDFSERPFHGHYLTRNRKKDWHSPSYTIVAHASHVPLHPAGLPMRKCGTDNWELQGDFNRRLSWKECALVQGLPETIAPDCNLDGKYRVVGNAVPPSFGKALVSQVVPFL